MAAVLLAGCGEPAGPQLSELELAVAGGDGQFGMVGTLLDRPLRAVVRSARSGAPREGVIVAWSVEEGEGASFDGSRLTTSGADGSVEITLRLGNAEGRHLVRASVSQQETATALFEAFAVERPELTGGPAGAVDAGDTIVLAGRGFSSTPEQDVVLFGGVRGRVLAATSVELSVEVPPCLPTRSVALTVRLGSVVSNVLALSVRAGPPPPLGPLGGDEIVMDPAGFACPVLSGANRARYLVTVSSASTVGAATHEYLLTGLAASPGTGQAAAPPAFGSVRVGEKGVQERFEAMVRARERALLRSPSRGATISGPRTAPGRVPVVGDRRTFKVLNADLDFDEVTAVARHVGSQAVLYVDESSPSPGFSEAELTAFASDFDEVTQPTVAGVFGGSSDLDENERVVVLFTPTVNRLTPRGEDGFVGGFFFGADLLPELENSNGGEIFYALVPDPAGVLSDPRPKDQVLFVVPGILAHEYQHMVHFNQRMLVLEATNQEAVWMSEALAQMAEELVAEVHRSHGDLQRADVFARGNRVRGRRFLGDPQSVSLIFSTRDGTLEERGAGWLYLMYLRGRLGGGNALLTSLTQTTRTGVESVQFVTGAPWGGLLLDWSAALFLDGLGLPVSASLTYEGFDLRGALSDEAGYPLRVPQFGAEDFSLGGSLWSSSVAHYIVIPPQDGSVALRLGGPGGSGSSDAAALALRIVRIQ